jgi:hypothetical protein
VTALPKRELTLRDCLYRNLLWCEEQVAQAERLLGQSQGYLAEARKAWEPYDHPSGVVDLGTKRAHIKSARAPR